MKRYVVDAEFTLSMHQIIETDHLPMALASAVEDIDKAFKKLHPVVDLHVGELRIREVPIVG